MALKDRLAEIEARAMGPDDVNPDVLYLCARLRACVEALEACAEVFGDDTDYEELTAFIRKALEGVA